MNELNTYEEYTVAAIEQFQALDDDARYLLVNAVAGLEIKRVLDVGCGAGQVLLPFLEKTGAICVGVDMAEQLGRTTDYLTGQKEFAGRISFLRAKGENLPFPDESYDLVLCRLALPYMNNRRAIGEISRILRPKGVFLLKTHALPFYLGMIGSRLKTLNPKQIAYPIICLSGGIFHWLTGKQPEKGFWKGKEVFQTKGFLTKEFARVGLQIEGELTDTNKKTPSYLIVKK